MKISKASHISTVTVSVFHWLYRMFADLLLPWSVTLLCRSLPRHVWLSKHLLFSHLDCSVCRASRTSAKAKPSCNNAWYGVRDIVNFSTFLTALSAEQSQMHEVKGSRINSWFNLILLLIFIVYTHVFIVICFCWLTKCCATSVNIIWC